MKNLTIHLFATFILVLCLSSNAWAQGKGNGNQAAAPIKPIFALPAGPKPDLIVSDFELTSAATVTGTTQTGNTTYRGFSVNYKATIKNIGTANCTNGYNVGPFYSVAEAALGQGFYMNNCVSFGSLAKGASRVITGKITFSQPANDHRDARVRLVVDSTCAAEFLPSYNFVDELNENNNASTILTVDIP